MPFVVLQSSDGEKLFVDVELAKHFGTIKNLLSCCSMYSEKEGVIPLPKVDANTLRLVLEWIDHHKDQSIPIIEESKEKGVTLNMTDWDKEFLNAQKQILFKLLIAANYLDIPGLMQLTSKEIANIMQGKTPQEIRDSFNIENDFTYEEEVEIWKGNDWLTGN